METMKMAAQFYIYLLAKAYISTAIYMSVYLKKKKKQKKTTTTLKFCLWKRAWGGLPVSYCEVVEESLCEIRWTAIVPDVAHNTFWWMFEVCIHVQFVNCHMTQFSWVKFSAFYCFS